MARVVVFLAVMSNQRKPSFRSFPVKRAPAMRSNARREQPMRSVGDHAQRC
jgi:hypothetical protein